MTDERIRTKIVLSNVSNHRYDVGDYKLCPKESEIVVRALERYLSDLAFDEELKVIGDGTTV